MFGKNKNKKPKGEGVPAPERSMTHSTGLFYDTEPANMTHSTGLSHFHYGNDTEPANEPVDPASEHNHMGPPGQYLTSLDSSKVSLKPGILI